MKVKRASVFKRGGAPHHEEERAAPEHGVCRTRAVAPPSGQDRLQWILSRVILRQKRLQSVLSAIHDSLQCRGTKCQQQEAIVAELTNLLSKCEPIFSNLRSKVTWDHSLSYTSELSDVSQGRCDGLDQLPLSLGSRDLLCLPGCQPDQNKVDRLSVTTFLYWRPTPYMSRVHTGLFKCVRWNVVLLRKEQNESEEDDAFFYFLCFEDVPDFLVETAMFSTRRIWSIGRWVQMKPNPEKETIDDWVLCEVPEGRYERLLVLGSEEPSISAATEALYQLLCSSFSSEKSPQNV